jgi:hypothetical protein
MTKRRSRVVGTFTAPHTRGLDVDGAAPRCTKCEAAVWTLENRPQDIPIENLRATREAIENAAPPYGEMVRADAAGVIVWACPRHTSLERRLGRTAHGAQSVEWVVVLDPEKAKAAAS